MVILKQTVQPFYTSSPTAAFGDATCCICRELLTDPVVLDCGGEHMVCCSHLPQLSACPLCRDPVCQPRAPQQSVLRMLRALRERQAAPEMQVFVRDILGKTATVDVGPKDSVLGLKKRMEDRTGMRVQEQRLIAAGKVLQDDQMLGDCGIKNGDTVHLIARMRGGGVESLTDGFGLACPRR